jgi:hypothetical protein
VSLKSQAISSRQARDLLVIGNDEPAPSYN